jgi:hypothetical protein
VPFQHASSAPRRSHFGKFERRNWIFTASRLGSKGISRISFFGDNKSTHTNGLPQLNRGGAIRIHVPDLASHLAIAAWGDICVWNSARDYYSRPAPPYFFEHRKVAMGLRPPHLTGARVSLFDPARRRHAPASVLPPWCRPGRSPPCRRASSRPLSTSARRQQDQQTPLSSAADTAGQTADDAEARQGDPEESSDPRVRQVGREICGEYARLRDKYGTSFASLRCTAPRRSVMFFSME